jgi:GTPase
MNIINEECTFAVCGPVDAGKSSLIGVLTSGELDDGRGNARSKILKHKHELESGRTSNITFNPLLYKKDKNGISLLSTKENKKSLLKFSDKSFEKETSKIISFIDLAGHEKYLKTTVYGVTGLFPDYGIVVIGANTGITKLTREHIGILFYLKIPFVICITKIDLAPAHVYQKLCNRLKNLLTKNTFGKIVYFISDSENNNNETNHYIENMLGNPEIIPVISISNKDGKNINNLHLILSQIPNRDKWNKEDVNGSIVYIDSTFQVPGIGLVLSGMVKGKNISVKDKLFLGPSNGTLFPVQVRSIHNSISENVKEANDQGQFCFAIKYLNPKSYLERKQIKKGMVLIDNLENWKNNIVRSFTARITILQHSTTVKTGYTPVIHCGPIRQAAILKIIDEEKQLRSGDSCLVKFTFQYHSEFIEKNMIFFFRDGNTKGVGEILDLVR